jgi:cell division protein FtsW (lipid II flippase)
MKDLAMKIVFAIIVLVLIYFGYVEQNPNYYICAAISAVVFVVIIILVNHYRNKNINP